MSERTCLETMESVAEMLYYRTGDRWYERLGNQIAHKLGKKEVSWSR
jgi:hypothetical protein